MTISQENQPTIQPVSLIGGGPGAWDLITVRGMNRLQEADVILADHLGPTDELEKLCDISSKTVVDVSKLPYGRQVTQERTNEMLVEYAQQGLKVVTLMSSVGVLKSWSFWPSMELNARSFLV